MEDDRVEQNRDDQALSPVSAGKILGIGVLVLVAWLAFAPAKINPSKPSTESAPKATEVAPGTAAPATVSTAPPVESKKEYIASTTRIGGKKAPIYYKEFFKSPAKFEGQRINLPGKVMVIEEDKGKTAIQMQVTGNYDSVIVFYDGSVPVYQGDRIMVYGEGAGVQDGVNRMGAAMTWPVINARYVVKQASAEE